LNSFIFSPPIWYNRELESYAAPFPAADQTIINRSEYHNATTKEGSTPVNVAPYMLQPSLGKSIVTLVHFSLIYLLCKFGPAFRFFQRNPELASLGMYTDRGPTPEQVKQVSSFRIFAINRLHF
jgi:hypothetical protein